jgi:hypothetical protein
MGKAQSTRQAVTIRLDESDAELIQWLGQFAQTQTMTKVVKLACYMMSGLQPEEGLLALLPDVQNQRVSPVIHQETATAISHEQTNDALAAVMQELSSLREELVQQRTEPSTHPELPPANHSQPRSRRKQSMPPPTLPEENWPTEKPHREPVPAASSGLDMSSPRRKRDRTPGAIYCSQPVEMVFDADEARRNLLASINAYGQEMKEGY